MSSGRRLLAVLISLVFASLLPFGAVAADRPDAREVLQTRYALVLELVRHTATYTPPVASRGFAYLGVTAYEAMATGSDKLVSLAGQLNGLTPVPAREAGAVYDEAVVMEAAMGKATYALFFNTGPTGQRAIKMIGGEMAAKVSDGVAADVVARSKAYGEAVADHVLAWAESDGGAVIENMGFPLTYAVSKEPGRWVPTSLIRQQQAPLLPNWGTVRPFAMPEGKSCGLPPPTPYSEDKSSPFYAEMMEVYDTKNNLTPEQKAIARFWSDDPMLSSTPPGHWIAIAEQVLDKQDADLERRVEVMARLSIVLADAFIGCWHEKFVYDYVRPITVIRKLVDPKWETLLITPPFPEYPSGHSTQSGAAAAVLTDLFGDNFAFTDASHEEDGMPARSYVSFNAAAEEAGISRLYGGIHFRSAVVKGIEQGHCIAAYTNALKTRR